MIEKASNIYNDRRRVYDSKRQSLINQRTAFESRRKVARDKLLSAIISDDDFRKIDIETGIELDSIEKRLSELNSTEDIRLDIALETIAITKDIFVTYSQASNVLKRLFLGMFIDRIDVADGVIINFRFSILFQELYELQLLTLKPKIPNSLGDSLGIIRDLWLPVWYIEVIK